ncbi:MAG: hypothetical protein WBP55_07610 [Solirubrobacterales bacterium]
MQLSPDSHHWNRFGQITLFFVAIALTTVGIAGLATQAKAGPVTLKFDSGQITAGLFAKQKLLPATDKFPSDSLPTPQRTDIELNGTETNGVLDFPALTNTGLQFPYMFLPHPLESGVKIPLTMRVSPPGLTGTYDDVTGKMTLAGKLDMYIITGTGKNFPLPDGISDVGVPPLNLFARCHFVGIPVNFSSETKAPFTASNFTGGFGINGSMTSPWSAIPKPIAENGGDCPLVSATTAGPGGIWFANGILAPEPQPPIPPTCKDDPAVCPEPLKAIVGVKVFPKKKKVRATRKVKRVPVKVKVRNLGLGNAIGQTVKLKSSNRKVKIQKRVVMDIAAQSTATKVVFARIRHRAKGKAKITAATEGFVATSKLFVKPKKKKNRKHK